MELLQRAAAVVYLPDDLSPWSWEISTRSTISFPYIMEGLNQ